jgi:NAD(P)-dependent dehydrogenase (short-subunit alcohol dehydrogenase family)
MRTQRVALVTGASSGFGLLTAQSLAARGFRVFGTSRTSATGPDRVEMLELDVTVDASVDACARAVLSRTGRIDVLVNNAGRTHASVVEETPRAVAAGVFETNFWGVVRMTNAVLPAMRAARAGTIINVSSLAGLVGVPGQAFYAASKHALEGYSESLQVELRSFNISVVLVEPGFFSTNLHHALQRAGTPIPDYDALRATLEHVLTEATTQGGNPQQVADLVTAVADQRRPALRYRIGRDARWVPRLKTWLPQPWFEAGMRRRFRLVD